MLGIISNLILVTCLVGSVAGSALVRVERAGTFEDILKNMMGPYGICGKPDIPIPHGGIKIFPVSDKFNPQNDSCSQTTYQTGCEPKFYCFDGYESVGKFDLKCVYDNETEEFKWEGLIPKCVRTTTTPLYNMMGPYGRCGKPDIQIPHGGVKIFPVSDKFNSHDDSCSQTTYQTGCEPKFYCFDGYEVVGNIHLECVHDEETDEYKWEGEIPKCVGLTNTPVYIYPVISVGVISFIVIMGAIARRRMRASDQELLL